MSTLIALLFPERVLVFDEKEFTGTYDDGPAPHGEVSFHGRPIGIHVRKVQYR